MDDHINRIIGNPIQNGHWNVWICDIYGPANQCVEFLNHYAMKRQAVLMVVCGQSFRRKTSENITATVGVEINLIIQVCKWPNILTAF